MPITDDEIAALQAAGLGDLGARLLQRIEQDRHEIDWRDAKLEKLTFEMAQLKRMKFGKRSEQLDAEQRALFDEAVDADISATEDRLKELLARKKPTNTPGERPKREALPPSLPRVERRHEPESKTCACGCALRSSEGSSHLTAVVQSGSVRMTSALQKAVAASRTVVTESGRVYELDAGRADDPQTVGTDGPRATKVAR